MKMLLGGQDVPFSISQQGFPAEKLLFSPGGGRPGLVRGYSRRSLPGTAADFLVGGLTSWSAGSETGLQNGQVFVID